jgi:hypothetical protein
MLGSARLWVHAQMHRANRERRSSRIPGWPALPLAFVSPPGAIQSLAWVRKVANYNGNDVQGCGLSAARVLWVFGSSTSLHAGI